MKTVEEVLTKALAIIETHGWTKGRYEDDKGCVCAVGAVNAAIHGNPRFDWNDYKGLHAEAIQLLLDQTGAEAVWEYNDADCTTLDEVRAMFRQAIAAA